MLAIDGDAAERVSVGASTALAAMCPGGVPAVTRRCVIPKGLFGSRLIDTSSRSLAAGPPEDALPQAFSARVVPHLDLEKNRAVVRVEKNSHPAHRSVPQRRLFAIR